MCRLACHRTKPTCYCGAVGPQLVGKSVILCGWVGGRRDHGGMVFIDLRDREGIVQLKFNPETDPKAHETAGKLRSEFCVCVRGDVTARPPGLENPNLKTGTIEVNVHDIDILSASETPRFPVEDDINVNDDLRLEYRFLDLRRPSLQNALAVRHKVALLTRKYFDELGFLEIETPMLGKSTPEGARDYLVPSRVHHGSFYALPQSPQLYKQILMVAGYDRYVQLARCFRDEDLRADRQPEFTQIDVEMAFVEREDILNVIDGLVAHLVEKIRGDKVPLPLPR